LIMSCSSVQQANAGSATLSAYVRSCVCAERRDLVQIWQE